MTIRPGLLIALVTLLTLAACSRHREVLVENHEAEIRWQQLALTDYIFHFQRRCECSYDYTREARITVSNGEIVDITFADDQSQAPRDMWNDFPTVAGLFEAIETAAAEDAHEIRVTYDPDAGYPQSIFIDKQELLADEEKIWQISDLQAVNAADVLAPAVVQLQAPQQAEGRFADAVQGCSLLSRDGRTVGCYREELDMGYVEDFLELVPVGSTEPELSLHLYSGHMGQEFDAATVDRDGIARANALLRQGGYQNIGVVLDGDAMEYRVTQIGGEIVVKLGEREARAPLPAFAPELVIDGFQGDPHDCLYWLPTQLTVFDREAIAVLRLQAIGDWNQDPGSRCYQLLGPDDEPMNDEVTGPGAGTYLVIAAGMAWPTATLPDE